MEMPEITLNLKTLLLTMMMFKWGKNSFTCVALESKVFMWLDAGKISKKAVKVSLHLPAWMS